MNEGILARNVQNIGPLSQIMDEYGSFWCNWIRYSECSITFACL